VLPVVVLELLAGIVLGPHVAGFAVSSAVLLFKNLGLTLLFFFAGYELDLRRIAGRPLRLGVLGWGVSLLLAYAAVGVLHWAGIAVSVLYTGSALATTAIGTLIPVLFAPQRADPAGIRRGGGRRRHLRNRLAPANPAVAGTHP
jgi:Kef-type K+ transport system membrane component KefB